MPKVRISLTGMVPIPLLYGGNLKCEAQKRPPPVQHIIKESTSDDLLKTLISAYDEHATKEPVVMILVSTVTHTRYRGDFMTGPIFASDKLKNRNDVIKVCELMTNGWMNHLVDKSAGLITTPEKKEDYYGDPAFFIDIAIGIRSETGTTFIHNLVPILDNPTKVGDDFISELNVIKDEPRYDEYGVRI